MPRQNDNASAGAETRRSSARDRLVPLAYLVTAGLMVALILPTALRPPPDQQTTTAEFSPDAPPEDDPPESIIEAIQQARSTTAGASGDTAPIPGDGSGGGIGGSAPSLCPFGFGQPPRQVESLYSAPCAGAFTGSNGGATSPGVTGTEIRVVVGILGPLPTDPPQGAVPTSEQPGETGGVRTLRIYQDYLNQRFQFYGRRLRLYVKHIRRSPTNARADAQEAIASFDPFATFVLRGAGPTYISEFARRRRSVVAQSGAGVPLSHRFYADRAPYVAGWNPDATAVARMYAEYVCTRLANRPAIHAGSGVDRTKTRRFGLLTYSGEGFEHNHAEMVAALQQRCALDPAVDVEFTLGDPNQPGSGEGASRQATAMAQMKAAEVTTMLFLAESVSLSPFVNAADANNYEPEWIIPGSGGTETNAGAKTLSPTQWRHAFGINFGEIARPQDETDAFRAYRSVDPDRDPVAPIDSGFPALLQIANGIQQAGPTLTPETFRRGLSAIPKRLPDPIWSIGGGYSPQDPTYHDYVSEVWWDARAPDAVDGTLGAYHHTREGRRYTYGQLAGDDQGVFVDPGITTSN